MKICETIRLNLGLSGFRPNQTHLLNMNHLISIFASITHVAFFFCEAENVIEYVNSAYFTTTTLGIFISHTNSICKSTTLFILIENLEKIVNRSNLALCKNSSDLSIIIHFPNFYSCRNKISNIEGNLHQSPSIGGKIQ